MTRACIRLASTLLCVIGATACASSKRHLIPPSASADAQGGDSDSPRDSTTATVSVENQRFADMSIYVVGQDGIRIRLGMARGHTTTDFTIPKYLMIGAVNDLRFIADPIGGESAGISQTTQVSPGDDIVMTIPPN